MGTANSGNNNNDSDNDNDYYGALGETLFVRSKGGFAGRVCTVFSVRTLFCDFHLADDKSWSKPLVKAPFKAARKKIIVWM